MLVKVLLIILLLIIYSDKGIEAFSQTSNKTPKIIWSYWDSQDIHPIVKLCRLNWAKFAPNYQRIFINKSTARSWVDLPEIWESLPAYRQSDVLRLKLIEKYGGVWLDASIFLVNNPDNFINHTDVTLFSAPQTDTVKNPVFDNWFMSAPKNNIVIKSWLDEVLVAIKDENKYVKDSLYINKKDVPILPYLICHLAIRNLYYRKPHIFRTGTYYESNKTGYYEHNKCKKPMRDCDCVAQNIFKKFTIKPDKFLIKLRKCDREGIDPKSVPSELYI